MILYSDDPNLPVSKDGGKNSLGQILTCGWPKCKHSYYFISLSTKETNQFCPMCGNDILLPFTVIKSDANKTV